MRTSNDAAVSIVPPISREIIPEDDSQFFASFGEAKESIAAIATDIAAGAAADLAFGDVSPNIVFRAVGVERDFGPLKHFEQLGLVGVESFEQAVEGDEAGLTREDAIEPRRQGRFALFGWREPIGLEIAVEAPNQAADMALGFAVLIGEGIKLVNEPLGMDPTKSVFTDVELAGVIADDDGIG